MVKPEFFDDPSIGELTPLARLFFVGLWTQADREGRLVDDVRRLKVRIFPYDDVDVNALAVELHGKDMIRRYSDGNGHGYIWIRSFTKHQRPHPKEPVSVIPPCENGAGKRNGEPCKKPASPSESGVLSLDSGTRKLEHVRVSSLSAIPDDVAERAGRFVQETYPTLYAKHRKGARYVSKPHLDFQEAVELCRVWDDARLEKIAALFLTTDHQFAESGSRTMAQFRSLASWCDSKLVEAGIV